MHAFLHLDRVWFLGAIVSLVALACGTSTGGTTTSTGGAGSSTGGGSSGGMGGIGGMGGMGQGGNQGGEGGINFTSGSGGGVPAVDVDVVLTADNAYSFGYGDAAGITTFIQGSRAQTAGQIFNCGEGPEAYLVPAAEAPPSAYLYIVTWDDLSVTQGVLGQFRRGTGAPLYTGDAQFEACATGINMQSSQTGPTQAEINEQIAICNSGSGDDATTSGGWVNAAGAVTPGAIGTLAVGEANDPTPGGTFPPTCPTGAAPPDTASIDPEAHWMWYQPGGIANPFQSTGSNTFRAYLIFRIAAEDIPLPPK
ncbi:hypothetical protein [Polyangium mundeleinium]|uniref:DUF3472 domain-containing protein n=1 Tax=Polyangium mundeleinium TaxID=2995306 RepID=A0ABT5EKP6_9BACT|nr:hypothetical protein [Polyangium mundeleinium]MDC0742410.1 hypothetical protein [Polyangium mundeleinium]